MFTMDEILSSWLLMSKGQDFLLVIADRISGIHGWKGKHRPIAYHLNGSMLIIEFDESEELTIVDATGLDLDSNGVLMVRDASEVRFIWHSHDDLQQTDSLAEEVFQKIGRTIYFYRTGDPNNTSCCLLFGGGQLITLQPVRDR